MEVIGKDNIPVSVDDESEPDNNIYQKVNKQFKKILVVDDIHYVVKSISRILTNQGYVVFTAATGKEALEKYKKHIPDLMTIDQKLPDMTGFQLVEKIRQLENGSEIKIIFISAVHAKEEIKSILNLGIDHYILKPFKKEKLIECIRKLFSGEE